MLAAWLSGKSVLLPPNFLDETLRDIRDRFEIALECDAGWGRRLPGYTDAMGHGCWEPIVTGDLQAVKLFTSGSSGEPRIVTKSLANLLNEADAVASEFEWPAGPVVATVPPQHLYGLTFSVLLPWVTGNAWVDEMPQYPRDIYQVFQRSGGRIFISVPVQYQAMLACGDVPRGIFCVSAAAKLPRSLAQQWQQRFGNAILEIYGSTETGVIGYRQKTSVETWQPFPQVKLSVERNLLKVQSPFMGDGTPAEFLTADRVALREGGRFLLLGRSDTIVKIAGKRVSLTFIEDSILSYPGIVEAAVIAVPAGGLVRDVAIWAVIVSKEDQLLSTRKLQSYLRSRLDGVEVPRRILVVDHLPRTPTGKLPRRSILELFEDHDRARIQV
jgi:4-coumarate--CoA ligase (photoactive yellow protein activation family)